MKADKNFGSEGLAELMTFFLDEDVFGLPVEDMLEVNRNLDWTPVPGAPDYVRGAANLRGHIVTIVDLRRLLSYHQRPAGMPYCVLIVNSQGEMVGLLVDRINDVIQIPARDIEPPPANLPAHRLRFLKAVTRTEGALVAVLNLESALDNSPGLERRGPS